MTAGDSTKKTATDKSEDDNGGTPTPTFIDIGPVKPAETESYDPTKDREEIRGKIALRLLELLFLVITSSLLFAAWAPQEKLEPIKDILSVIFGPTVALVGSVAGFYYGTKSDGH